MMDNPIEKDYLFDGRKVREPETMSYEERVRFHLFTEKKTTSFRPTT